MTTLAMRQLQAILGGYLAEAQDAATRMGARVPKATLILRDPDNPGMVVCVTNDDPVAAAAQATRGTTDHGRLSQAQAALALIGIDPVQQQTEVEG